MVENLRKMQELRAQIQAQLKLADTLKKLNENAGEHDMVWRGMVWYGMAWYGIAWYDRVTVHQPHDMFGQ